MDLTRVEWRGGMSYGGSSGEAGVGDPGSRWDSSSSTYSSSTCLREVSKISREKSKGGSKVSVEGTKDLSGKISKTDEKHKDDERQDHNTYTLFEFRHNQGNNKV